MAKAAKKESAPAAEVYDNAPLVGTFDPKAQPVQALKWNGGDPDGKNLGIVEKFLGDIPVEKHSDKAEPELRGKPKFPPRIYETGELRLHVPLSEKHLGSEGGPGLENTVGVLELRPGDWLVKDEENRFTRIRGGTFEETYKID